MITQESYDAKMHYAKTARTIDNFMNSLSTGTRETIVVVGAAGRLFSNSEISLRG